MRKPIAVKPYKNTGWIIVIILFNMFPAFKHKAFIDKSLSFLTVRFKGLFNTIWLFEIILPFCHIKTECIYQKIYWLAELVISYDFAFTQTFQCLLRFVIFFSVYKPILKYKKRSFCFKNSKCLLEMLFVKTPLDQNIQIRNAIMISTYQECETKSLIPIRILVATGRTGISLKSSSN